MKKYIFIFFLATVCFAGNIQAQFLIDQTYIEDWQPQRSEGYNQRFNNGNSFEGVRKTTGGRVDGYYGTFRLSDGSFYVGDFNANFAPIGYGWYVKDNVPYYNTYNNYGQCTNSTRVETNGRSFSIMGKGRSEIVFADQCYDTRGNYNSNNNSYNNSNRNSYTNSNYCRRCNGSGKCGPCNGSGNNMERVGYGVNLKYTECRTCNGSGRCQSCGGRGRH